jgi:hypothetical protein
MSDEFYGGFTGGIICRRSFVFYSNLYYTKPRITGVIEDE